MSYDNLGWLKKLFVAWLFTVSQNIKRLLFMCLFNWVIFQYGSIQYYDQIL